MGNFFKYWLIIAKRGFVDTWHFMQQHVILDVIGSLLCGFFGLARLHYYPNVFQTLLPSESDIGGNMINFVGGVVCFLLISLLVNLVAAPSRLHKEQRAIVDQAASEAGELHSKLDSLANKNYKPDKSLIDVVVYLRANTDICDKEAIELELTSAAYEKRLQVWAKKRVRIGTILGGIDDRLFRLESEIFEDHRIYLPYESPYENKIDPSLTQISKSLDKIMSEGECKEGEIKPGDFCAPMFLMLEIETLWPPTKQNSQS